MLSLDGYVQTAITGTFFFPHLVNPAFKRLHETVPSHSPITPFSYYMLYVLALQCAKLPRGCFFECGVFRGGSARFLAQILDNRKPLHLFDSFEGMKQTDADKDPLHIAGDFADTSLEEVQKHIGPNDDVLYHKGWIPDTFAGIDEEIAFAHVDVDLYDSVKACCEFIYPRLVQSGIMLFDDYGHVTCRGAREAVDAYFYNKPSVVIPVITGQAYVIKI